MLSILKRLLRQQSGNDLVEYALLMALIVVAVIVSIYSFGRSNQQSVSRASQAVSAGGSGGGAKAAATSRGQRRHQGGAAAVAKAAHKPAAAATAADKLGATAAKSADKAVAAEAVARAPCRGVVAQGYTRLTAEPVLLR